MKKLLVFLLSLFGLTSAFATPVYRVPLIHTNIWTKFQTYAYFYQNGQVTSILANVDTGSPSVVMMGSANICPSCYGAQRLNVNPDDLKEGFKVAYGVGHAAMGADLKIYHAIMALQNTPKIPINVGVITRVHGSSMHPIIGMDPQRKAHGKIHSFMYNLAENQNIPYDFGLMLCPTGGEIDLGGIASFVDQSTGQSVPFEKRLQRFSAPPQSLSVTVNGQTNMLGRFPPVSRKARYVLDCGTPTWVVSRTLYRKIARTLARYDRKHHLGIPIGLWLHHRPYSREGVNLSTETLSRFNDLPVFNIHYANGTILHIHADTYLRRLPSGHYAFMIVPSRGGAEILGDTVLMNYYVQYNWRQGQATFYNNQGLCRQAVRVTPP